MAEAGSGWFSRLTWEDHILDILLFGWIAQCFMVYVVVSALHTFVGPLQRRPTSPGESVKEGGGGTYAERTVVAVAYHVEPCNWLNTALNWGYLHYYYRPEWVDQWVNALNEQVARLGVSTGYPHNVYVLVIVNFIFFFLFLFIIYIYIYIYIISCDSLFIYDMLAQ